MKAKVTMTLIKQLPIFEGYELYQIVIKAFSGIDT
jgi:hypothetical protein